MSSNMQRDLKASRYNHVHTLPDGTLLLFNFYTLKLLALRGNNATAALEALANPELANIAGNRIEIVSLLMEAGMLIDEAVDELAMLRRAHLESRFGRKRLSLTIAPTLACNFRCTYCYQPPAGHRTMSHEVQQAVVSFADKRTCDNGSLSVTWFGGEPLLCMNIVSDLSKRLIDLCERKNARYSASMITNGYHCDAATAKRLLELGVRDLQITVDGPADLHDGRRKTRDGSGTFHRILDNIRSMPAEIRISLRMNVDTTNRDRIEEFLDILVAEGLQRKVAFYIGQVQPYTDVCRDISESCVTDERFSVLSLQTLMKMSERGFSSAFNLPRATDCACIADNLNGFVISPSGAVAKCWNEVAQERKAVGHLLEERTELMVENGRRWGLRDPFTLECGECSLLPICMGGCPYNYIESGEIDCHRWRHHTNEALTFYYYYYKRKAREVQIARGFYELVATVQSMNEDANIDMY